MVKATIYTRWDHEIPKLVGNKFSSGFYLQNTGGDCVITLFSPEPIRESVEKIREVAKNIKKLIYDYPVLIEWANAEMETL